MSLLPNLRRVFEMEEFLWSILIEEIISNIFVKSIIHFVAPQFRWILLNFYSMSTQNRDRSFSACFMKQFIQ